MKLVNSVFDLSINIDENTVDTIVLESPIALKQVVNDLLEQCSGKTGEFILSDCDEIQKIDKKCDILLNPFLIDENSKKILSKLYAEIKEIVFENQEKWFKLNSHVLGFIDNIAEQVLYENIVYDNEADIESILKAYNFKFSTNESIYEKLMDFIKIGARLLNLDILFLIHFKDYFTDDELLEIYKIACYNKIHLIMIESYEHKKSTMINEKVYIVDSDLCTIIK